MILRDLWRRSRRFVTRLVYGRSRSDRLRAWERNWKDPSFLPAWRVRVIPAELQECVGQQWFPFGGALLDVGCGAGECAQWLSEQGFCVTGVDFAPSAIARAQAKCAEHARLRFQVLDICRQTPDRMFDALFDRGCMHGIGDVQRVQYVKHVAAAASRGAHFLLLHKLIGDGKTLPLSPSERSRRERLTLERIQKDFQETFEIAGVESAMLPRSSDLSPRSDMPALAIRLVRR